MYLYQGGATALPTPQWYGTFPTIDTASLTFPAERRRSITKRETKDPLPVSGFFFGRTMNQLYPIFVKLQGRPCLVVGGGAIAAGKVRGLRDAGALVTVVSPTLVDELAKLARAGLIRWMPREFTPLDLEGVSLVIASTNDREVSRAVFCAAEERGILCNAVDQDESCSFHVPAVASRGDIKVAVSTAGKSPAFCAHLKSRISSALSDADERFVEQLGLLRTRVLGKYSDSPKHRKAIFQQLVESFAGEPGDDVGQSRSPAFLQKIATAKRGTVYLVGAGPGDAGLLTLRGAALLWSADTVYYDRLVGEGTLDWVSPRAELIYVGKESGKKSPRDTGALLVEAARSGKSVVRLKGGDPNVFGRGGDEMVALHDANVPFEVVAGVSALTAVPASAGIPITLRDVANQVVVRSGYRNVENPSQKLASPSPLQTTYVYFMTVGRLTEIINELLETEKLPASTPVAIVQRGTRPDQRVLVGDLSNIVEKASRYALKPPALIVAGDVVQFAFTDTQPARPAPGHEDRSPPPLSTSLLPEDANTKLSRNSRWH